MGKVRDAWDWFWYGRVCPRCSAERTGHRGQYVTGVPVDEWVCMTCSTADKIRAGFLSNLVYQAKEAAVLQPELFVDEVYPHCDMRVLHAPGRCVHCDAAPKAQRERIFRKVNFTGQLRDGRAPCPSDLRRGLGGSHVWRGNRPRLQSVKATT